MFLFTLATVLKMPVAELEVRMTSRELSEWMAYDRLSPLGPERDDLRAALISTTVANFMRKRRRAFKLKDFMLKFKRPARKASQGDIRKKLLWWKTAVNTQFEKKQKRGG